MSELVVMLERRNNIWKMYDHESTGPDTAVDQEDCAPHIATDMNGSPRGVGMSVLYL